MKHLSLFLLVALLTSAASIANAGDKDILIFNGKKKFRDKWVAGSWGGLETKIVEVSDNESGPSAVSSVFGPETAPWSGISLQLAFEEPREKEMIPLDEDLRKKGTVVLSLNCGKTKEGKEGGDQELQIGMTFVVKGGERVSAAPIPMSQLGKIAKLDGKPNTWQEVQVELAALVKLAPDPSAVVGIWSVNIQYFDTPLCEILVGSCVIKQK